MAGRGSAPGERRGGRQKGTPNKASAEREKQIAASGMTPLDFMLKVMRDRRKPVDMRLDAAAKAAPFVHPKLASIIHKGDSKQPIVVAGINAKQFEQIASKLCREI